MNNITITRQENQQVFFITIEDLEYDEPATYIRLPDRLWWYLASPNTIKTEFDPDTVSMLETIYQQWKNNTDDSPKKILDKG